MYSKLTHNKIKQRKNLKYIILQFNFDLRLVFDNLMQYDYTTEYVLQQIKQTYVAKHCKQKYRLIEIVF